MSQLFSSNLVNKVKYITYNNENVLIMKDNENKSMDYSRRNDSCNGLIYFNKDCDPQLKNV